LEELRANIGDKLDLKDFTHCCRTLSYPITDLKAQEEFQRLALDGNQQMNFAYNAQDSGQLPAASLCFRSWIAHRKTQNQTLEPSVGSTTSHTVGHNGSINAESSNYDHSGDHAGPTTVLQRAKDLHDILQDESSQELSGSMPTVVTPSNMPPIPPKALPTQRALRYGTETSSDLPSETLVDEGELDELAEQFHHIPSPVAATIDAAHSPTRLPEKGGSGNLRLCIESGELVKDTVSSPIYN
jgi:hypothetical protein